MNKQGLEDKIRGVFFEALNELLDEKDVCQQIMGYVYRSIAETIRKRMTTALRKMEMDNKNKHQHTQLFCVRIPKNEKEIEGWVLATQDWISSHADDFLKEVELRDRRRNPFDNAYKRSLIMGSRTFPNFPQLLVDYKKRKRSPLKITN